MDLQTGEKRAIDEVNSPQSESFHNWSIDGKWFLFTSRRENGLYTRLYFSMIDAQGRATKPFLLPQRNPKEYYNKLMFSYNTPDFTTRKIEPHPVEIGNRIESGKRTETQ